MHPEVKSDKPGKCRKCAMELTEENKLHGKYGGNGRGEKRKF